MIAQARQTAKRISDHSQEAAANTSFLSWFGMGSADPNHAYGGSELDETGENVKKTHEFLDRALENLCQIFKVPYFVSNRWRGLQLIRYQEDDDDEVVDTFYLF